MGLKVLAIISVVAAVITGCQSGNDSATVENANKVAGQRVEPTYSEVTAEAKKHERIMEDGWYFGELPRIFKSGYGAVTPEEKAKFAMAQAEFLKEQHQDMAHRFESYVPYSKRAEFAVKWWQASDRADAYAKQPEKLRVLWILESLMDGNELWWRACEEKNHANMSSEEILAHDEEQKKLSRYEDVEGQPRSLSDMVHGK